MNVRALHPEEIAALAEAVSEQPLLVRYGVTRAGLQRSLARALEAGEGLLVGEVDGAPRGFAWFLSQGGLGLGGYLKLIALAPGMESKGLGRALLTGVEQAIASRSDHLLLLVSDFNLDAQRFYERAGYTRRGAFPALVLPDVTELLYHRRLR